MKELVKQIEELKNKVLILKKKFLGERVEQEIADLDKEISSPVFWQNQREAKEKSQRLADLKERKERWQKLNREVNDLLEIARADDKDKKIVLTEEIKEQLKKIEKKINREEFFLLFNQSYDRNNAILSIHAGAGGVDAQDWAEMLMRMYLRFAERKGWQATIIDQSKGNQAGLKSVTLEIVGQYAYGHLKSEKGVHRLVRISPFDAEKMRHTSFALVEVLPELEDIKLEINPEDLRVDTFLASGHGGQYVQKTQSAVRIVHLPTKITVSCQSERSQYQNKERAMKILRSKLYQYYQAKREEEKERLRGKFKEAAWGNQIRSYVLHPYKMVKDHRTEYQTAEVEKVLDGEIDELIEAYLRKIK